MEGPGARAGRELLILGIETSCDETAAAVVVDGKIRSNVVSSQAHLHARFGGVVPEIASRHHLELVLPVVREALAEAQTGLDDAAGEAFDKGARLLGLGYPGGAGLDRLAREGDPEAFAFPVARVPGLDFSFSGVKTALLYETRSLGERLEERRADLAASYQRAIVRALAGRTLEAASRTGAQRIAVVGGVAANSELRAALPDAVAPPLELCTDNAAMIASAARYADAVPCPRYLALDAYAQAV